MMTAKIVRTKPNVASCVSGNTDRESPPSYFCSVVLLMEQASSAICSPIFIKDTYSQANSKTLQLCRFRASAIAVFQAFIKSYVE